MAQRAIPPEQVLTPTAEILEARRRWGYTGARRPPFAARPAPSQQSVWDFPRPPRLEAVAVPLRVLHRGLAIAETTRGVRVLETAGAPTYYFPPEDTDPEALRFGAEVSMCEWKGIAQTISVGDIDHAGWRYTRMFEEFSTLWCWPSFYAGMLDCFVGAEQALPQPGGYYGGWVTGELSGPIKGDPMFSAAQWSEY
jgi:uncharacterized protein (DUF427 family)